VKIIVEGSDLTRDMCIKSRLKLQNGSGKKFMVS
jgi:hypothetical protein